MTEKKDIRRIGIMTGGGDCPGLNAVIRAVAKTAIHRHGLEVWGIEDGFLGLIRNRMRRLDLPAVSNILNQGGTILGASNKANPAHFSVGHDESGEPIFKNVYDRVLDHLRDRRIDAILCAGGDGTMTGLAELARQGIPSIGLPKTIDNDLMHTEITFGFQTAVATATEALDRIHTTASSHHRVMIVELMGRNAGWLALHAGIASGSDVILIPEIPYNLKKVGDYCLKRSRHGSAFTIIAVGEGATAEGGEQVVDQVIAESPDPVRLGGIGRALAKQIGEATGLDCRATILGHVQRGGTPVPADRVLGTNFGHYALELLMSRGEINQVVVQQEGRLTHVPLEAVSGQQRLVPPDHELIRAAKAIGCSFGDE